MARAVTSPDAAAVAASVQTLAVLLQAGVAPDRAWTHLAASGDAAAIRVSSAARDGMPLATAIAVHGPAPAAEAARRSGGGVRAAAARFAPARRASSGSSLPDAWRDVAAAWSIATTVGAPLAESLRGLAGALRDTQEAEDEVRIALAEPTGTARLMGWLPLVGVLLGILLGFDVLGVLLRHPLGIVCLIAGVVLVVGAQRWSRRLARQAAAATGIPGLDAELVAIALTGGVSIDRARRLVSDRHGAAPPDASIDDVLALSRSAGVPAVELLRATAALSRHRARVDGRLRASRLSTRLLLPLGVCTLPAFLFLGVAPMLLSVLSAVPLTL